MAQFGHWTNDLATVAKRARAEFESVVEMKLEMPDGFSPPAGKPWPTLSADLVDVIGQYYRRALKALDDVIVLRESFAGAKVSHLRGPGKQPNLESKAFAFAVMFYWRKEKRPELADADLVLLGRACGFERGSEFDQALSRWKDDLHRVRELAEAFDPADAETVTPETLAVYLQEQPIGKVPGFRWEIVQLGLQRVAILVPTDK